MSELLNCGTHGQQPKTYVCKHIIKSMESGVGVGFLWSVTDGEYDAICHKCNQLSEQQWQEQQNELGRLLCLGCFKVAAKINDADLGRVN